MSYLPRQSEVLLHPMAGQGFTQSLLDIGQQVQIGNQVSHTVGVVFFEHVAFAPTANT
jgi:hypothetical protein